MKALVVGWFSYEHSDFTAGDVMAGEVVRHWLADLGISCDTALARSSEGGVDVKGVDPSDYQVVVFVCGPFMRNAWEAAFLDQFAESFVIGVNLSLPLPLEQWNPFDVLLERDSNRASRPDISILARQALVPVVGVCLVEPYDEADVPLANAFVARLVESREMSVVPIDTRLDANATGLRTPAEVESLLARMDAVITTRLHGTVLSLRNGVPALVIDPEVGGGRIRRQAESLDWPVVFTVDALDDTTLANALDFCLTAEAHLLARQCSATAIAKLCGVRPAFEAAIKQAGMPSAKTEERLAFARKFGVTPPAT